MSFEISDYERSFEYHSVGMFSGVDLCNKGQSLVAILSARFV